MSHLGGFDPKALLVGRLDRLEHGKRAGASTASSSTVATGTGLVTFDGASNLLTFAPNGSGRDRSCLIPNLLTYAGQVVVVDIDGKTYAATAEARRAMGHAVVRLDPFGIIGPESDALNPIDLLDGLESAATESACQQIADLIPLRSPFGGVKEQEAFGLLSGVIGYLKTVPEKRSFDQVYSTFHQDDVVYTLAVVLDTIGKKIPKMSYTEIASFLEKEDRERSRTIAKVSSHLKSLGPIEVQKSLKRSSVPLSEMLSGAPVTVYLIIPAERLALDSVLLRIWIGTLLLNLLNAARSPVGCAEPTLFLLDYCAELGMFPLLESLLRVASGQTFRIWTFWHDLYQLRTTYPRSWPEIISGCGAMQVFGTKDAAAAGEAAVLLGLTPGDIWSLQSGEQFVRLDGTPHRVKKIDLEDDLASITSR